jgi:hypothetical protein
MIPIDTTDHAVDMPSSRVLRAWFVRAGAGSFDVGLDQLAGLAEGMDAHTIVALRHSCYAAEHANNFFIGTAVTLDPPPAQ